MTGGNVFEISVSEETIAGPKDRKLTKRQAVKPPKGYFADYDGWSVPCIWHGKTTDRNPRCVVDLDMTEPLDAWLWSVLPKPEGVA